MDMSEMDDMSGMDSSSSSMFKPTNMYIARVYWYFVAAFVTILGLVRLSLYLSNTVVRRLRHNPGCMPVSSRILLSQFFATVTALCRETSYPQPLYFTGRFSKSFTPPPLANCLILLTYWTILLIMLFSNTILTPSSPLYAYKWEIVGFRAAWVSVTQLPLIYCLSGKLNPVSMITGISYERLNWIHRWSARTLFLTVIIHWTYFYREWAIAGAVKLEFSMMPMVRYGFGAWAVMGWMILSGFGFFRQASYEVFVLQHIAAAATLLWLVYVHVPSYATYNIWMAITFVVFDWSARALLALRRNLHLLPGKAMLARQSRLLGYQAEAQISSKGYIQLRIKSVSFPWRAGQHLHISIPRLGLFQSHPFSISNAFSTSAIGGGHVELYIKAQKGFTRRLYNSAERRPGLVLRTFINGPFGIPPTLTSQDTVVFIATSTGISFTMPLFVALCRDRLSAVRHIHFHWIIRDQHQIGSFRKDIFHASEEAESRGVDVTTTVHITRFSEDLHYSTIGGLSSGNAGTSSSADASELQRSLKAVRTDSMSRTDGSSGESSITDDVKLEPTASRLVVSSITGRPPLTMLLLPPIERAMGETAIIGCGGLAFTAELRNYVAAVSDERAVHKGTGAQGIFLFTETYGW